MKRTRLLLVGAGRRAQSVLLPAMHCMQPWIELVGVCTRTARELILPDGRSRWSTTPLGEADVQTIDVILVAVPARQVPRVLATLQGRDTTHVTLMLDTPVLDPRDMGARRAFSRFRRVLASEECFALPPFVLARRLLREGAVGRLRRAYLFHSGFRYHALASLKQLAGVGQPARIAIRRWNPSCADIEVEFRNGVRATIVEPRRYDSGRMMIVGSAGFLTDYPMKHKEAVRIDVRTENGRYVGLSVNGAPEAPLRLDSAWTDGLAGMELADVSLMTQLKIRGFMELLAALGDDSSPFRYPADEAILDNISLHLAERLGMLSRVPLFGRSSLLGPLARTALGFLPPRGAEEEDVERVARNSDAEE